MSHDTGTIDRQLATNRADLGGIARSIEAFDMLTPERRQPILDRIGKAADVVHAAIAGLREIVGLEIARERGDDEEVARKRFRDATGG